MIAKGVRRYLYLAAAAALLVGGYAAFGFLGVPSLLRAQARDFVAAQYGRELSIGEIRFNPFTLTLEVRSLAFPDADAQRMLGFNRLLVNLDVASLWRRGLSFREIALDQPFARVLIRPDGSLNLADLGKPRDSADSIDSTAPPPAAAAGPARLFIDRFEVRGGRSRFEDRSRAAPFVAELQPVTFELRDFSTTGGSGNAFTLAGASAAGERFRWDGTLAFAPLGSRGRFEVNALQARTVWSYLRESLPLELTSGHLDVSGAYELSTGRAPVDLRINVSRVALAELGVKPRGAAADAIRIARVEVTQTQFDLAQRSVTVGQVRLSGGSVNAWRDAQGRISLLELAGRSSQEPPSGDAATADQPVLHTETPASSAPSSHAWRISVPDIQVEGFDVALEDRQVTPVVSVHLNPFNASLAGFSLDPAAPLQLRLDTTLTSSAESSPGRIAVTATLSRDTGSVAGQVELAGLDLRTLQPYIAQRTSMTLLSGLLSTKMDVQRDAQGALALAGGVQVRKLRTIDNALREDFIKWETLRLEGVEYDTARNRMRIAGIVADAPYARVIIAPDRSVNVSRVLSAPGAAQALADDSAQPAAHGGAGKSATPATAVSIGSVRIRNGSANFADFWIQPNFAVGLENLTGSIVGLSSDARTRAKVQLEGKVDRYAPARISGEINPLAATAYSDIKMSFKSVELTTATPYSGRFAGYKIEKGKLSVDLAYKVENRQLTADHRFVIDQLQLGEPVASPDAVHLPLKLAVALLKDRNGVIDVGLPVSGSLDDPQFRLGPIIWKAVLGLLTKIVTAPFALLGSLFGGSEEMNLIDFEAGGATLGVPGQERLDALRKALTERPQLRLDVPMAYAPELDRPVLMARALEARMLALKRAELASKRKKQSSEEPLDATLLSDPAERYRLLLALLRADSGKDAPLPQATAALEAEGKSKKETPQEFDAAIAELEGVLAQRMPVPDAELEALGRRRAEAIQAALLGDGALDPSRVFVITSKPQPGTEGKVRLAMSLQ